MSLPLEASASVVRPQLVLGGRGAMGFGHDVAVLVLRVRGWTLDMADALYAECSALTGGANPRTMAHMVADEPSARVRHRMAALQKELDARRPPKEQRRVAVIADSAIVRGATTALGWVTGDAVRGFASRDGFEAAKWVAHEPEHAVMIFDLFVEAQGVCRRAPTTTKSASAGSKWRRRST